MEFLKDFGINPILLAAQAVNFLILLLILNKFLYKPVLKMLEDRKKTIAESLKNAALIEEQLQKTSEEKEKVLEKAASEAQKTIDEATKNASQIISQAHIKAQADVEKMIAAAQSSIAQDRDKMSQELKSEVISLVVLSLQKITGKVLSQKDKEGLIRQSVNQLTGKN